MDRNEAVLREFNLYPLWKRRGAPAPVAEAVQESHTLPQAAGSAITIDLASVVGSPSRMASGSISNVSLDVGVEQRESQVSTPSLTLPLQVGGNVALNELLEVNVRGEIGNLNWPELKQQVRDCTACKLRAGCAQTVFGVGDENAEWLFVGEGPGADEDAQGEPFVGQAGKLLDNMLLAIKLRRGKNVYIANIVKCRPPNNRNPDTEEIAACMPYLQRQIELIQPKLIVALGKVASNALLGKDATIASLRGTLHDYRGTPLIVTYHPAYLLRSPTEKAMAWQDLCLAVRTRHGEAQPSGAGASAAHLHP